MFSIIRFSKAALGWAYLQRGGSQCVRHRCVSAGPVWSGGLNSWPLAAQGYRLEHVAWRESRACILGGRTSRRHGRDCHGTCCLATQHRWVWHNPAWLPLCKQACTILIDGFCRRDPDAFGSHDATSEAGSQSIEQADPDRLSSHEAATTSSQRPRPPYIISKPVPSDAELSGLLLEKLQAAASGDTSVLQGLNVSADSFYSSQVHCTAPVHVTFDRAACA